MIYIQHLFKNVEGLDYIFLGDYEDRGTHSLETICLLIRLKIKYPNQIHLLRGNHKDRWINSAFGFQAELISRMNDDENNPVIFTKFNDFFDYLSLAAIINDTVLCLHCGIGSNIATVRSFLYNEDIGYIYTDFVYPGKLISNIGDNICRVLDKIKEDYRIFFIDID